jgi:DNA-binding CsgD family transcriptional regulator
MFEYDLFFYKSDGVFIMKQTCLHPFSQSFVEYCLAQMQEVNQRKHEGPEKRYRNSSLDSRVCVGESYLTAREYECIQELLQGKKYAAIAASLGLSKRTVEFYLKNIMKKFSCRNKRALLEYFSLEFPQLLKDQVLG